jgi:hypothetical protein
MAEKRKEELEGEELEGQDVEELPNRDVMSVITPEPIDGGFLYPLPSEDEEIIVEPIRGGGDPGDPENAL